MPFEGEGEDDGAAVNDLLPDATIAVELRSSELLLTPEEARAGNVLCLRAIELSPIPEARSISHWFPYDRVRVENADP